MIPNRTHSMRLKQKNKLKSKCFHEGIQSKGVPFRNGGPKLPQLPGETAAKNLQSLVFLQRFWGRSGGALLYFRDSAPRMSRNSSFEPFNTVYQVSLRVHFSNIVYKMHIDSHFKDVCKSNFPKWSFQWVFCVGKVFWDYGNAQKSFTNPRRCQRCFFAKTFV